MRRSTFRKPAGIAQGKLLSGGAITEMGDYYRLDRITTTAEKDGDHWVINGAKSHVINGGASGVYSVLCRTGDGPDGTAISSMFLVDANQEGLSVVGGDEKLGLRCTPPRV